MNRFIYATLFISEEQTQQTKLLPTYYFKVYQYTMLVCYLLVMSPLAIPSFFLSALPLYLFFFFWTFEVFLCRGKECHQVTIYFCFFFALLSTYYLCTSVFLPILVCTGLLMTDAKAVKLVDTVTMVFFSELLK